MHSGAGTIKHLLLTIVHSVGIQMRQFQLTEVKTVRFSGVLFLRVLLFPDTQRDVTDTAVFLAAIMCYSAITLWLTIHQEIHELAGGCMGDPTKDGGSTATLQISNNVLYNWGYNTCYGGGYAYTNYINNYLKAGIGTREVVFNQLIDMGESTKPGGFYVNGNYMEGNAAVTADNSKGEKMSGATSGANKTEVANNAIYSRRFCKCNCS